MSRLNFVVALPCEAQPIVAFYKLKRDYTSHVFEIYHSETISLIITGVGKIKTAAAVGWLSQQKIDAVYLNIGIAGSSEYAQGSLVRANKIIDKATGWASYPFITKSPIPQALVQTVDQPESTYPATGVVDMEAAAFFQTARLFTPQELVQSLKIISDTNNQERQAITAQQVKELVIDKLDRIDQFTQSIMQLSQPAQENKYYQIILQRWHFSHYQQNKLRELLRRWQVLQPNQKLIDLVNTASDSRAVLKILNDHLKQVELVW